MSALPHPKNPSDPLRFSSQHPDSPPNFLLFDPNPELASAILEDLIDPFKSFASIAQTRGTTLEGLILWMQRPDIARRLDALESACTRRSRLQASGYLPLCVDALARAISGSSRDESHTTAHPSTPKLDEQRRKARETLLRMTRVMMQLSKFQHAPAKSAKPSLSRPAVRSTTTADPRTSNSSAPSRVAAPSAPRPAGYPERRGDIAPPRVVPTDQSQSHSGRTPQSDQRVLASV